MPNTIKDAAAPQAIQSTCNDIQNLFNVAKEQTEAALAILDAASVLCALERSPERHDTHPSHNIKTGGGYAHGRRLLSGTLPALLEHAHTLVAMSFNDFDCMRAMGIDAVKGGAA